MDDEILLQSPRKKLKTGQDPQTQSASLAISATPRFDNNEEMAPDQQKENDVGILVFVQANKGTFGGVLKQRYSDFLVNEISPAGEVYHLDDQSVPKLAQKSVVGSQISESTEALSSTDQRREPTPSSNPDHPNTTKTNDNTTKPETPGSVEEWQTFAQANGTVELVDEQRATFVSFLGESVTEQAVALFNKVLHSPHRSRQQYGSVRSEVPVTDRQGRTRLHQLIRECFRDRLDSYTEPDSTFVIQAKAQDRNPQGARSGNVHVNPNSTRGQANRRNQNADRKDRLAALGGDYLHFSLYKENKDTMEVVSFIASRLHMAPKMFQFAGTKDRRAVTVQRVSVFRVTPEQVAGVNRQLRYARIGNFSYHKTGLELGALAGNAFVITLRDCAFADVDTADENAVDQATAVVQDCMHSLVQRGFINYYGLQRFGTRAKRTDLVGRKLLQGDYEGAIDVILHFDQAALAAAVDPEDSTFSRDDKARALAIDKWRRAGVLSDTHPIPRKFSAEVTLMRTLRGLGNRDFLGAILAISRNLRLIYIHAYQSLIWNLAASHRWTKAGSKLLAGDLVLVREHKPTSEPNQPGAEVDEDGEPIVRPAAQDRAVAGDDRFERARALTQEEVDSGLYNIFDIVLPTPGFDIVYPDHMLDFYKDTMGKPEHGGLDPLDMRRPVKDLSLSGSYRKLLARPGAKCDFKVVKYTKETEQFVITDGERLDQKPQTQRKDWMQEKAKEDPEDPDTTQRPPAALGFDGARESKELDDDVEAGPVVRGPPIDLTAHTAPNIANVQGWNSAPVAQEEQPKQSPPAATEHTAMDQAPVIPEKIKPTELKPKLAVVLTLQLGASTYATVALRELTKGGAVPYKPDFGGGR